MPSVFFTDPFVRSLRPVSDSQIDHWDQNVTGLVLRLSPAGKRTWAVYYRVKGRRRLTLGTYPVLSLADARARAQAALHSVAVGDDPAALKQQPAARKRSLIWPPNTWSVMASSNGAAARTGGRCTGRRTRSGPGSGRTFHS